MSEGAFMRFIRTGELPRFSRYHCPHCGSRREPIVNKTTGFRDRRGCLDCDEWIDPCELDGSATIGGVR